MSNMRKVCADRAIEGLSAATVISLVMIALMLLSVGGIHFFKWWMGAML